MKKGQSATEYLIILAVVIVIALIVIGIMGGIPGIGKGKKQGISEAYWESAEVGITDVKLDASDDVLYFKLKNNQKQTITVTNVEIDTEQNTTDFTLGPGEKAEMSLDLTCTNAGDEFSYEVTLDYTNEATDAAYTFTGVSDLEGTCAE